MAERRPLSASLEDYLETIYLIVQDKQAARAKDIVERLGVHKSSVTQALRSLAEKGLVNYAPYDLVTLTDEGRAAALDVVQRHRSLRAFLEEVLGLAPEHAEADACRLEHDLSPEVARRLRLYMTYHREHPGRGIRWDPDGGGFGTAEGTS